MIKLEKTRQRSFSLITALMLVLSMFAFLPGGAFRSSAYYGSGTKAYPYVVSTYDDLETLLNPGEFTPSADFYVKLGADIVLREDSNYRKFKLDSSFKQVIHLDLAGHKLARYATTIDTSMFLIGVNNRFVVDDSVGGGTVECNLNAGSNVTSMFNIISGGTLEINGGTFRYTEKTPYVLNTLVWNQGGEMNINGGNFYSYSELVANSSGDMYIRGGNFYMMGTHSDTPSIAWVSGDDVRIYNAYFMVEHGTCKITFARNNEGMSYYVNFNTTVKVDGNTVTNRNTTKLSGSFMTFSTPSVETGNINFKLPVAGRSPDYNFRVTEGDIKIYGEAKWIDTVTGKQLMSSDAFVSGRNYDVVMNVHGINNKTTYMPPEKMRFTFNKTIKPDISRADDSVVVYTLRKTFTATDAEINEVKLQVSEPIFGQTYFLPTLLTPNTGYMTDSDGVKYVGCVEYESNRYVEPGETFKPGYYKMYAYIVPTNDCHFSSSPKVYFNGYEATANVYTQGTQKYIKAELIFLCEKPANYLENIAVSIKRPEPGATRSKVNVDTAGAVPVLTTRWLNVTDNVVMGSTSKFEAGKKYKVTFNLGADTGYVLADSVGVTVNGTKVSAEMKERNGIPYVLCSATFNCIQTTVDSVAFTASEPAAGAKVSQPTLTTEGAKIASYSWVTGDWKEFDRSKPFEAGKSYILSIVINPEDGRTFADGLTAKINGKTMTVSVDPKDKNKVFCYISFKVGGSGSGLRGDVDDNNKVNMKDLVLLRRYLNKWDVVINLTNANMNGDKSVNLKDLVLLQRKLNKWPDV